MRTIIAGSRGNFSNEQIKAIHAQIDGINSIHTITEVISGGAPGVDNIGEMWAEDREIPKRIFNANWKAHGKAAGPMRNADMARYGDMLLAFWRHGTPGTYNMITNALKQGLVVHVYYL